MALLLAAWAGCHAETTQTLTINGVTVEKTVTKIQFDGDNVILHFGDDTGTYDLADVTLSLDHAAGIGDVATYTFSGAIDGNTAKVSGAAPGARIDIYDINGTAVRNATAGADGEAAIDLTTLPAGTYIMAAGNKFIKFVKH